jgi:hypothetical protein
MKKRRERGYCKRYRSEWRVVNSEFKHSQLTTAYSQFLQILLINNRVSDKLDIIQWRV